MQLPNRRYLVLSLVLVLLLQLFNPIHGFASDKPEFQNSSLQEPKITLEQAIQIVKENFNVPEKYTEFTSGYSNYNYRQVWSLNWNASGDSGGNFSAQVDALSGEILSINTWKSTPEEQSYQLPKITLEQAQSIAVSTVRKLSGSKYSRLKLMADNNIIPINTYGSASYTFRWQRIENSIPVQGNGANIQVAAGSGEILSYNLNWNDVTLPKTEGIISKEQAIDAFSQNKMLELQYFLPSVYRPLATGSKEQVQLVYQLNKNGIIDALSGEPLILNQYQRLANDQSLAGMGSRETAKSIPLTPQEQREVEQNAKLLTKDQAIEVVKKWVNIPAEYSLRTMNLNTDGNRRDTKVWYFEWLSPDKEQTQTTTARVDAINGELQYFNFYSPDNLFSSEKPLTKEEAQKMAEDFLKKIQPSKFQQARVIADESARDLPLSIPDAKYYTFNYERIVNGIAFPSNGMNITVDLNTKKITSYSLNWWNLDFPQLSQAISQTQANTSFLKSRPLVLKYTLVYDNGEPQEAKLVYQPSTEADKVSDIMDAKTGELLDWQGKPLMEEPHAYRYSDIKGNEFEKEITALGLAGIFGEYGNLFKPQEKVTVESFLKALLIIQNGASFTNNLKSDEILQKAKEQGWIRETLTPTGDVSRELFSKIIISYLGLEKIADLNIYKPSFQDAEQLTLQSEGYVSLAAGLNILKTDGAKFEPARAVTREEAAYSIIQTLSCGIRL